ncbi:UDP-arabinose 4-epimerase 1 [Carex littledalei]|uniref:UDP-arabinose 4-epimerase 1 n=1 Tax=Carex littledalei TaxID=544730 RepID=A0A833VSA1_9POAL|nr:UDP-arabinose 4-epimerase 1 [Carex littledalei]
MGLNAAHKVNRIFSENAFDAVMHFAAVAYVGESTLEPLRYYHNITSNTLVVLEAMAAHGVKTLIYSSTCATYGEPDKMPITEETPQNLCAIGHNIYMVIPLIDMLIAAAEEWYKDAALWRDMLNKLRTKTNVIPIYPSFAPRIRPKFCELSSPPPPTLTTYSPLTTCCTSRSPRVLSCSLSRTFFVGCIASNCPVLLLLPTSHLFTLFEISRRESSRVANTKANRKLCCDWGPHPLDEEGHIVHCIEVHLSGDQLGIASWCATIACSLSRSCRGASSMGTSFSIFVRQLNTYVSV